MFIYPAKYISNYDGDTIKFQVDLGFGIHFIIKVRLYGINTYELKSKDASLKEKAYLAKNKVKEWLESADDIVIKTYKDSTEKYGRYLATVLADGLNINEQLLADGLAEEY